MKKTLALLPALALVLLAAACAPAVEPGLLKGQLIGPNGPQAGTVKLTTFADQACVDLANKTEEMTAEENAVYEACHQSDILTQATSASGTYTIPDLPSGFYQVNFQWDQSQEPEVSDYLGLGFRLENRSGYLVMWLEPAGGGFTALAIGEPFFFDADAGAVVNFDYNAK